MRGAPSLLFSEKRCFLFGVLFTMREEVQLHETICNNALLRYCKQPYTKKHPTDGRVLFKMSV